jgi:Ca2+-binding EF-hand superfamily protein
MRAAFRLLSLTAALALGVSGGVIAQGRGRAIRFADMDRDADGVITRSEWRGSDQSFRMHDWNGDGVLSGDELRPGARRNERNSEEGYAYEEGRFDDWTPRAFSELDRNNDGRITRNEWRFDVDTFKRADHNGDGRISRAEFLGNETARPDDFASIDVNRDGRITLSEWQWSRANFDNRDTNHDGYLTREEFESNPSGRSVAYRAGYDRGLIEGRAAGREDHERNQGWDLEGQRELETADSGYESRLGLKSEYQAGYRDGFRRGYREGYGPRPR